MMKVVVMGAGGFIGSHLVTWLKLEGNHVVGVDLKYPEFEKSDADNFVIGDLRDPELCDSVLSGGIDELYQLAADMGGAGYIFTGENDFNVMHNSGLINLNVTQAALKNKVGRVFYSSSACIYPQANQLDPDNPNCEESSAYPADPDSEYGWEKLFSERIYLSAHRNYGMKVRIARFHNVYGPHGTFEGGKEKAPAALCRKVAMSDDGKIEVWGDGSQTRSFLFIDDCIKGIVALTRSDRTGPYNIGSEEMVSIRGLAEMAINCSGKTISINYIDGPIGVMGRNSENSLIRAEIGWEPSTSLKDGLSETYKWISEQVSESVK